jgi:putative salt-induced outer membrane protein YdiY
MLRSSRLLALLVGLVVYVAAPAGALAQIVNIQSVIDDSKGDGFSGALDAGLDWRTGNTRLVSVRGAALAQWRRGDHLVFGALRGEYGESGDPLATFVSKSFAHVRYRHSVTDVAGLEAFAQHETDELRRLRTRALVGAGPRLRVLDGERGSVHVGVAAMLEREQLLDDAAAEAGDTTTVGRASSYVVGRIRFDDRLTGSAAIYVQPRLDAPRDVRSLGEAALGVKLVSRLSLTLAFVVTYDSRPPPETVRVDTSLQNSISVAF